jgi:hypothetical protein
MLKRGLSRPYYNGVFHPGGIDIDRAASRWTGRARCCRVWALGYPAEGAHYYTHACHGRRCAPGRCWMPSAAWPCWLAKIGAIHAAAGQVS